MTTRYTTDTFARLAARASEPAWLTERREEALARFDALAWPTAQEEDWRHTDLRPLDIEAFDPTPPQHEPVSGLDAVPAAIKDAAIGRRGDRDGLAIQVDADVVHSRLRPALEQKGVVFAPLSRAAAEHPDLVADTLGRAGVSESDEKIAALTHAFFSGGTFLYVPRGVALELPVQSVRWITRAGLAVFPRVVIVADEGAEVTYIDHYGSADLDDPVLAAAGVEIYAQQGARVSYFALQDWAQTAWHFNVQRALIGRDATVRSLAATFGAKVSRSRVDCLLDGQGATSEMLGLYFGDHDQHIDNRSLQDHRAPHTTSDLYYKGALKGTSRSVYSGLVHIGKGAQKSDAQQANRNLLLSEGSSADPKPFLEIEANDVRCTHGVSVGRPDREVLFYMQSRGLDADEAERVFVKGFFQEIIDRVHVPETRATLEEAIEEELALEDAL
jgi:Fe-S cluster assembly protein SufD